MSGSADFWGNVVAVIPEPESYALILARPGAMFFIGRRRNG